MRDVQVVNVNAALAQEGADGADDAGPVLVAHHEDVAAKTELNQELVDGNDARLDAIRHVIEGSEDAVFSIARLCGEPHARLEVPAAVALALAHPDARLLGNKPSIDLIDAFTGLREEAHESAIRALLGALSRRVAD